MTRQNVPFDDVLQIPLPRGRTALKDRSGEAHVLEIGAHTILLDGQAATVRLAAESLLWERVGLVGDESASLLTTPDALWYTLAGEGATPSPAEAGRFLAENLARWLEQQHLHHLVQRLASEFEQHAQPLALPQPRLDPFVEEAIARLPQAPPWEKITALAQVLEQPVPDVLVLLRQRGKDVPENKQQRSEPLQAAEEENERESVTDQLEPLPGHSLVFRWTAELERELTEAYLATPIEQSTFAAAKEIARLYGWPQTSVDYKIRALKLPARRAEQSRQREPEAPGDQEGDQPCLPRTDAGE